MRGLPDSEVWVKVREALNIVHDVDEDLIFEKRTAEALERVESRGVKGVSASQFLKELDSW